MSKDDNDEVLAMARAFHESIKDAEELYQALKAENARLREAAGRALAYIQETRSAVDYASGDLADTYYGYVAVERQLLGAIGDRPVKTVTTGGGK